MNKLERIVYDYVKRNPKLKNLIRDSYQRILSVVPKKKKDSQYRILEREGFFFGFHDKVPWSGDHTKLLAHRFELENRDIHKEDEVEVGYFSGKDYQEFKSLGKTNAWNWQQGAMLQWVGDSNEILYNDWNGKKNHGKIIDQEGNLIKELEGAVGALDPSGSYGLSYSFERLNIGMYGYGYANENDPWKNEKIPGNSGLTLIDINENEEKMLFSIEDMAYFKPEASMENAYHFFTHCLFSPGGERFLFLHRWYHEGRRMHSRMISCDLEGKNRHIFPTNDMVSHITWVKEDKVFAYCGHPETGDGYYLFEDQGGSPEKLGSGLYHADGHPQHSLANDKIVTDTYPNRFRIQELSIYDYTTNEKDVVAKLKAPIAFKEVVRCDLHPRWNRHGTMLCFDSAHTGKRALCTLELKK